jgi:hypothetical protein
MNWYKKAQIEEDNIFDDEFMSWFQGSKVVDSEGNPLKVYHGTRANFNQFDLDYCAMGVVWFSSDEGKILAGESGACGSAIIKEAYLSIKNPAGWNEYEKYSLGELDNMGYDGIFLDEDFVVFEVSQIKVV